ncbi:type VII secretion-associated protein [Pseudonocardia parietis]|uniref:Type VII secretion-associated protein (TIGR03931 family) n=1 Tax=Pseudonocardia parietis TaxID=570936 RepID=A0ABS4VPH0_9PSEU|nr:type VII secretion-associated protein [Pseudonocardia parietis]MBP2365827.1 type VII secretion-associated protein (TIGR03931 family) [Pseudonocardia parietis]
MTGYGVAVHARPYGVLLAAADGDGVRLLAAAPAGTAPADAVGGFFGDGPPAVVVRVGATPDGPFPGEPRVVAVPVAVAVLAVGPQPLPGPVLVVDVGGGAVAAAVVEDGAVLPVAVPAPWVPEGGVDEAAPPGDRVGESTAGHPVTVALAAVARRAGAVEIVLAGEPVADDPGWGTAVAGLAPCPVRLAGPLVDDDPAAVSGAGPDTAAVLGAALLGAGLLAPEDGGGTSPTHRTTTGTVDAARAGDAARADPAEAVTAAPWGDRDGRGGEIDGPDRMRRLLPAVALLGAVLVVAGSAAGGGAPTAGADVVVQYGYAAALPAGWEHTGGDPARRRTLLTPADRPDGTDLIVVERSPLPYDAGREPERVHRELAALLDGRDGVTPPGPRVVAGRPVLGYTQHPGDGSVLDWHVLLESDDQLVVGCRRPRGAPALPACAEVVGSLRRVP